MVVRDLLLEDDGITVWWGTWVECAVAVNRLGREGKLSEELEEEARFRLDRLADGWTEIQPTDDLRLLASLVAKEHTLKAADAFQLAAALRWCEGEIDGANFVRLDNQLRRAVADEGFDLLPEDNS